MVTTDQRTSDCPIPSNPIILWPSHPIPSFFGHPIQSHHSLAIPSNPIILWPSHPIPSFFGHPIQSHHSLAIPSNPITLWPSFLISSLIMSSPLLILMGMNVCAAQGKGLEGKRVGRGAETDQRLIGAEQINPITPRGRRTVAIWTRTDEDGPESGEETILLLLGQREGEEGHFNRNKKDERTDEVLKKRREEGGEHGTGGGGGKGRRRKGQLSADCLKTKKLGQKRGEGHGKRKESAISEGSSFNRQNAKREQFENDKRKKKNHF